MLAKLKEIADRERFISVRGVLPNAEVLKRQKQVSVLVNPRKANRDFTKYSFPSKTIEYMASGTPMMGYRLHGVPDEYYEYIFEIAEEENGLENCLKKVMTLSSDERERVGMLAERFIRYEKNGVKQCRKIIDLVERVD